MDKVLPYLSAEVIKPVVLDLAMKTELLPAKAGRLLLRLKVACSG